MCAHRVHLSKNKREKNEREEKKEGEVENRVVEEQGEKENVFHYVI